MRAPRAALPSTYTSFFISNEGEARRGDDASFRAMSTPTFVARGIGGVEDLRAHLRDDRVLFGVLRFCFGRGTFARWKSVFVHFNGAETNVVRRGRANAMKHQLEETMGPCSVSVTFGAREECDTDGIVERLARVVSADGQQLQRGETPTDFVEKVTSMKADIAAQLVDAKRMLEENRASASRGTGKMRRLTLKEMGQDMSLRAASKAVRAESGPFNWYALRPDANGGSSVANAGTGSLDELTRWLPTDEVMFGLLRVGFGKGALRRVKHVFVHWSPENVNPLKRGQLNAHEEAIRRLVGSVNISHFATTLDELEPGALISKIKDKVIVDGEAADNVDDLYSLEAYMVSCEEETEILKKEMPEALEQESNSSSETEEKEPTFQEALDSVRSKSQPYNWMLCAL